MPGAATGLRSTKSPTAIAAVPTVRAAAPQTNREKMRVLHLIRRIGALNRGNIITPRQIESACSARLAHTGHNRHSNDMTKPDLALSQIAARFTRHDVEWSRGAFMIIDRRTANPIARLRPIPDTDRFELFYWSNVKGRW